MPLASVIVPVHNAGEFLKWTIDSALAQTLEDFELIVVDDGSTDGCVEQLGARRDARLRILRQPNRGAPSALNAGLDVARGTYIGFLDHDDLWLETKLARHIEYLEQHYEADVTFSWSHLIDASGRRLGLSTRRWRGALSFHEMLADFVIGNTSAVVMRRGALESAGRFDPELPRYYDVDLLLRVALLRPANTHAIPEELTLYRRHTGQMSKDWRAMQRDWERLLAKVRRLAPSETGGVERRASANMHRYFAWLAYESRGFADACRLLGRAFALSPGAFLADLRNWKMGAACLAGLALPARWHRALERLATR